MSIKTEKNFKAKCRVHYILRSLEYALDETNYIIEREELITLIGELKATIKDLDIWKL